MLLSTGVLVFVTNSGRGAAKTRNSPRYNMVPGSRESSRLFALRCCRAGRTGVTSRILKQCVKFEAGRWVSKVSQLLSRHELGRELRSDSCPASSDVMRLELKECDSPANEGPLSSFRAKWGGFYRSRDTCPSPLHVLRNYRITCFSPTLNVLIPIKYSTFPPAVKNRLGRHKILSNASGHLLEI